MSLIWNKIGCKGRQLLGQGYWNQVFIYIIISSFVSLQIRAIKKIIRRIAKSKVRINLLCFLLNWNCPSASQTHLFTNKLKESENVIYYYSELYSIYASFSYRVMERNHNFRITHYLTTLSPSVTPPGVTFTSNKGHNSSIKKRVKNKKLTCVHTAVSVKTFI